MSHDATQVGAPYPLEVEALAALSGADEVRKRLLALLSMGQPSLDRTVYLIKCRVKEHAKLVEKVIDRRKQTPTYTAHSATDIVGLRLITLYRDELPLVIRHFLSLVAACLAEFFSVFKGPSLRDTLTEILIYHTSEADEPVTALVTKELEDRGFSVGRCWR